MKYGVLIAAVVTALFFRAFLLSVYKVTTQTMAPTLVSGDFILASKISYGFKTPWSPDVWFSTPAKRGDLVVFQIAGKVYIKRVVAVSQDQASYRAGELSINSETCRYSEIAAPSEADSGFYEEKCGDSAPRKLIRPRAPAPGADFAAPIRVATIQLLVMSDNRTPIDGSAVELISVDQIIGKPLFVWMSYSSTQDFISDSLGVRWNRILTKLH